MAAPRSPSAVRYAAAAAAEPLAQIEAVGPMGITPLQQACAAAVPEMVRELLRHAADPNALSSDRGLSALHYCVTNPCSRADACVRCVTRAPLLRFGTA